MSLPAHTIQKILQNRKALIVVSIVLFIILEGGWLMFHQVKTQKLSIAEYATQVVSRCSTANYRPTCYDDEIPKLMDVISMEDAFEVTRQVQDKDPAYAYCHVLGHKLAARETAKDPSKWESVIPRCPSGLCSNGCVHGAFQERFRKESFDVGEIEQYKPIFANICEEKATWKPTGMEQATCYHALGHLLMYATHADIPQALNLCRELTIKGDGRNFSQLCFDGTFMQIFQPLEPDDFALIKGKEVQKEDVDTFCNKFTGSVKGSCRSESWPLFRAELNDPKNVVNFCSYLKKDVSQQNRCLSALLYVLTAQWNFDVDKLTTFCTAMPGDTRGACFAHAASRMLENDYRSVDKAVKFCNGAVSHDPKGECYAELLLYSNYNYHADSPERARLCASLPDKWKNQCSAGTESVPIGSRSIQH